MAEVEEAIKKIPQSINLARKEKALAALHEFEHIGESGNEFPSLIVTSDGKVQAKGSFAELQSRYMSPVQSEIDQLSSELRFHKVGVVVHFYMSAELQGLLQSCASRWPHIFVADSLAMGDAAISMCKSGEVESILVLGVDFMAENVRAVLDFSGFPHIPVYRLVSEPIGCSLASAADSQDYKNWLQSCLTHSKSLGNPCVHVVYINTSLSAKAMAQSIMPTVACTSSNVVKTILQLSSQISNVDIWYGPDSFMGANLKTLFLKMSETLSDEQIKASMHSKHNRQTIRDIALNKLHCFEKGYCIVHNIFGADVVRRIRELYVKGQPDDAFLTAHLEVPGEMFQLAIDSQSNGNGIVGSTSDILSFISQKVELSSASTANGSKKKLRFLLGTESGMVTSIIRKVHNLLNSAKGSSNVESVEIIFPVSSQAITVTGENSIPFVPGVCSGEGCSASGGCASCPFMKMNTLDGLKKIISNIGSPNEDEVLKSFKPKSYGKIAEQGVMPISAMRYFQKNGEFSVEFVNSVKNTSHQ